MLLPMRLYLSSYEIGDHPDELIRLVGPNKRAAVILNALDFKDEQTRKRKREKQFSNLKELGFEPEEIDLRQYFGKTAELENRLSQFGLVWVRGGNTFILKRAYEQSGFDRLIKSFLERDAFVYGGFSAGVVIAGPTLHGTELCDDPVTVPTGYKPEFDWKCLGLIDYVIAPHFRSDHPEAPMIEDMVDYLKAHNMPYKTLHDGDVIVVENGQETFIKRAEKLRYPFDP